MANGDKKGPVGMLMGGLLGMIVLAIIVLVILYFVKPEWVEFLDFLPFLDFTNDTHLKLMPFRESDDEDDDIRSEPSFVTDTLGGTALALTHKKPADDTKVLIIQKVSVTLDEDADAKTLWSISDDDSYSSVKTTGMSSDDLDDAEITVSVLVLGTFADAAEAADAGVTTYDANSNTRLPIFDVVTNSATPPVAKTYTRAGVEKTDGTGKYYKLKLPTYTVADMVDDSSQDDAAYKELSVTVTKKGTWIENTSASPSTWEQDDTTMSAVDSITLRFRVDKVD